VPIRQFTAYCGTRPYYWPRQNADLDAWLLLLKRVSLVPPWHRGKDHLVVKSFIRLKSCDPYLVKVWDSHTDIFIQASPIVRPARMTPPETAELQKRTYDRRLGVRVRT